MEKVIVLGDPSLFLTTMLLKSSIHCTRDRHDMQIVAVCDAGRESPMNRAKRIGRLLTSVGVNTLFNPGRRFLLKKEMFTDMVAVANQHGLPVLVPPDRDINHPEFIALLKREFNPTIALSFGCLQIYKKELLDVFETVVNYHNGQLPNFGGLHATAWGIYQGEVRSGYTFHLMDVGIDTGNILIGDSIPVPRKPVSVNIDYVKLKKASQQMDTILDLISTKDPGKPQTGPIGYYSAKDYDQVTIIEQPGLINYAELKRRLRAFDLLRMKIGGNWYRISRFKRCSREQSARNMLAFTTADNVHLMPVRFDYKSLWLQRIKARCCSDDTWENRLAC